MDDLAQELLRRFGGATPEMLRRVLTPYRLELTKVSKEVEKTKAHRFVRFEASVPPEVWSTFEPGVSGKVVAKAFVDGKQGWCELLKARVHTCEGRRVTGELHLAGSGRLDRALCDVRVGDVIEIDPFGVTSKIESALTEAAFFANAKSLDWAVTRMPENVAMHLGTQNYYDFKLEREDEVVRVELKSLWGTDTTQCRLIHTKSRDDETGGKNTRRDDRQVWRTSSCRFEDQDLFAVNMWLRTGRITDFAYALSIPRSIEKDLGLPATKKYPEHVVQNTVVPAPPSGAWTSDLQEACRRLREVRKRHPRLQAQLKSLRSGPH